MGTGLVPDKKAYQNAVSTNMGIISNSVSGSQTPQVEVVSSRPETILDQLPNSQHETPNVKSNLRFQSSEKITNTSSKKNMPLRDLNELRSIRNEIRKSKDNMSCSQNSNGDSS